MGQGFEATGFAQQLMALRQHMLLLSSELQTTLSALDNALAMVSPPTDARRSPAQPAHPSYGSAYRSEWHPAGANTSAIPSQMLDTSLDMATAAVQETWSVGQRSHVPTAQTPVPATETFEVDGSGYVARQSEYSRYARP